MKYASRVIGLDILRTIAILLVVYLHGGLLLPEYLQNGYWKFYFIDGVSIFFVLSGFLIGGILLRIIDTTNFTKKDLLNFWIRRWFRTIPNYMIILMGLLLYRILIFNDLQDFSFKYFFFIQNFSSRHPFFFSEAWSLGIEEWFYLLFPLTCYFLNKLLANKRYSILYSAIIFLIIPLILRIIKFELKIGVNDFDEEFRKITIFRLDSLMYGIVGAYLYFFKTRLWSKYKYILLITGVILLILINLNLSFAWIHWYMPLFFNVESIAILLLMPYFSELKTTRIKYLDLFFVFVSTISYSMYLLNLSIVSGILLPITNNSMGYRGLPREDVFVHNYFLFWLYTIIGSYLLYYIYENRMTKLREKIKFIT